MLFLGKSITIQRPDFWRLAFSNSITYRQCVYEKLEKQSPFVRHRFSTSEVLGLLWHEILVNVERHLLPQLTLSRNLRSCEPILLSIAH